jgi:predicted transcriptional regulator
MLDTMPRRSRIEEPTTTLTLRLPTELLERLRRIAIEQDRSLNAQLVRALRAWVDRYEPEREQDQRP